MKKIHCIGGANIDFKFSCIEQMQMHTSNPIHSFKSFGGVARNIAENLSYLTSDVCFQGVVGNDIEGQELLTHLENINVNTAATLQLKKGLTSRYYAVLSADGELQVAFSDMRIYDAIPFIAFTQPWQQWQVSDIVCLDTNLPAALIQHALDLAREKQLYLGIDPVSVAKSRQLPTDLTGTFFIKPNRREAEAMTGISIKKVSDCIDAAKLLLARGIQHICITLDADGYFIMNNDHQVHIKTSAGLTIHDVNGAGDAFVAGILYGLQQRMDFAVACEMGAEAATITLQVPESSSPILAQLRKNSS